MRCTKVGYLARTDSKLGSSVKIFINKSSNGSSIMKKTYDDNFKKQVAKASLESGATLKSVGEEYGVNPTLVRNWRIKFQDDMQSSGQSEIDVDLINNMLEAIEQTFQEKQVLESFVWNSGGELNDVFLECGDANADPFEIGITLTVSGITKLSSEDEEGVEDTVEAHVRQNLGSDVPDDFCVVVSLEVEED